MEGGDGDDDERRELPPSLAQQEAMSRLSNSTAGWRLQEIAHRESERELKELQGCTFEPTLKWEFHKGEHGFTPSPEGSGRKSPKRSGDACFRLYETMKMKEELEMMYAHQREETELDGCTFHPNITKKAARRRKSAKVHSRLHRDHSIREKRRQQAVQEQERKAREDSNTPQNTAAARRSRPRPTSSVADDANLPVHERLHMTHGQKQDRMEKLRENEELNQNLTLLRECTFAPKITKYVPEHERSRSGRKKGSPASASPGGRPAFSLSASSSPTSPRSDMSSPRSTTSSRRGSPRSRSKKRDNRASSPDKRSQAALKRAARMRRMERKKNKAAQDLIREKFLAEKKLRNDARAEHRTRALERGKNRRQEAADLEKSQHDAVRELKSLGQDGHHSKASRIFERTSSSSSMENDDEGEPPKQHGAGIEAGAYKRAGGGAAASRGPGRLTMKAKAAKRRGTAPPRMAMSVKQLREEQTAKAAPVRQDSLPTPEGSPVVSPSSQKSVVEEEVEHEGAEGIKESVTALGTQPTAHAQMRAKDDVVKSIRRLSREGGERPLVEAAGDADGAAQRNGAPVAEEEEEEEEEADEQEKKEQKEKKQRRRSSVKGKGSGKTPPPPPAQRRKSRSKPPPPPPPGGGAKVPPPPPSAGASVGEDDAASTPTTGSIAATRSPPPPPPVKTASRQAPPPPPPPSSSSKKVGAGKDGSAETDKAAGEEEKGKEGDMDASDLVLLDDSLEEKDVKHLEQEAQQQPAQDEAAAEDEEEKEEVSGKVSPPQAGTSHKRRALLRQFLSVHDGAKLFSSASPPDEEIDDFLSEDMALIDEMLTDEYGEGLDAFQQRLEAGAGAGAGAGGAGAQQAEKEEQEQGEAAAPEGSAVHLSELSVSDPDPLSPATAGQIQQQQEEEEQEEQAAQRQQRATAALHRAAEMSQQAEEVSHAEQSALTAQTLKGKSLKGVKNAKDVAEARSPSKKRGTGLFRKRTSKTNDRSSPPPDASPQADGSGSGSGSGSVPSGREVKRGGSRTSFSLFRRGSKTKSAGEG